MDFGLAGKVAVATGAASEIGRATAELFAGLGVCVVASDSDAEHGEAAARRSSSARARRRAVRDR